MDPSLIVSDWTKVVVSMSESVKLQSDGMKDGLTTQALHSLVGVILVTIEDGINTVVWVRPLGEISGHQTRTLQGRRSKRPEHVKANYWTQNEAYLE
jgi:hypothetical protein